MDYRRVFVPGGNCCFTLVTCKRGAILVTLEAVEMLRSALRDTLEQHPYTMAANVNIGAREVGME